MASQIDVHDLRQKLRHSDVEPASLVYVLLPDGTLAEVGNAEVDDDRDLILHVLPQHEAQFLCRCGYEARDGQDLDDHVLAAARVDPGDHG